MARSKALRLLLLFGLVSLSSTPAIATSKSDFFYLTLMWPGAFCNTWKCCCPTTGEPARDFFVQALETYDSRTGEPVTRCNTTRCRFSVNKLQKLIDDLYSYWPDLSCPSNNGVQQWKDVWCTYGTCSNLNETYYFKRALALRDQVDVLSILETKHIVPSSTKVYKLEDIQNALIHTLGFSTAVDCNWKWRIWPFWGDCQLYKIRICVSCDAKSIINCPIQKKSNCSSMVKFPPFEPDDLPFEPDDMTELIKMPAAIDMDM